MIGPRHAVLTQTVVLLLLGVGVTWFALGMRPVLDLGGACASGGPYVVRAECPDGSGLVLAGFPLAMLPAMVGSVVVKGTGAPSPLLLMWVLVFGAGGWNFLDAGLLDGSADAGWIVTGVLFWAMALPAAVLLLAPARVRRQVAPVADDPGGAGWAGWAWWALAVVVLVAGVATGWATYEVLA